jgi:hypothetical protein
MNKLQIQEQIKKLKKEGFGGLLTLYFPRKD